MKKAHTIRRLEPGKLPSQVYCVVPHIGKPSVLPGSYYRPEIVYCIATCRVQADRGASTVFDYAMHYSLRAIVELATCQKWNGDVYLFVDDLPGLIQASGWLDGEGLPAHFRITWLAVDDPPRAIILKAAMLTVILVDIENYGGAVESQAEQKWVSDKLFGRNGRDTILDWEQSLANRLGDLSSTVAELLSWGHKHDFPAWQISPAGIAWRRWRTSHHFPGVRIHGNRLAADIERSCLHPGRLECFRLGKVNEPVYKLDVNSLYPYIASFQQLPYRLESTSDVSIDTIMNAHAASDWFAAWVELDTPERDYPVAIRGKCFWARGQFRTALCGDELRYACSVRHVRKVLCGAHYKAAAILHYAARAMLDERHEARRKVMPAAATLTKRMAVGLIGRWARRQIGWYQTIGRTAHRVTGSWYEWPQGARAPQLLRRIAGKIEVQVRGGETPESLPAVTAAVHSYARDYMQEVMAIAGHKNVLYIDTDCVHVTQPGFDTLRAFGRLCETSPGLLKIVAQGDTAEYFGLRDYRIGDYHCHTGRIAPTGKSTNGMLIRSEPLDPSEPEKSLTLDTSLSLMGCPRTTSRRYRTRVRPDGTIAPIVLHELG